MIGLRKNTRSITRRDFWYIKYSLSWGMVGSLISSSIDLLHGFTHNFSPYIIYILRKWFLSRTFYI